MIKDIEPGVAAIDIGADRLFVAVAPMEVRSFGTFTRDLQLLGEYLQEHGVRRVAMEATGVYWIPVHDHLQGLGIEATLFNGRQARNLPGRKSDVQDCQWHAMLHGHGLLEPCHVPDESTRQLRSYCRLRDDHISLAATHVQHMQKALDLMNVRIHRVISQLHGVSGMRIVEAILSGERDARCLAQLCDAQILRKKEQEVIKSLEGDWREHHLFELRQALEGYKFYQVQIAACYQAIEKLLRELTKDKDQYQPPPGTKVKKVRHNAPANAELHSQLVKLCHGCDPTQISGISQLSFLKLVGELGVDLSRWRSKKAFVSYLGLAPRKHESGKLRRRIRGYNTKAGQVLREAAQSIAMSKHIALGGFYRRVCSRRGPGIANKAVARKLAEYYYDAMTKGWKHVEQGIAMYQEQYRQQQERTLYALARRLGMQVLPATATPSP